jgi:Fe-Mn family superoxide dismutase
MAFVLPKLPYDYGDFEPHFDAKTMEIHHSKHHASYIANLNSAIEGTELESKSLSTLLTSIKSLPTAKQAVVRNNAGGHYNHTLFWTILSPKSSLKPSGALLKAITSNFGSFDAFKTQFETAAKTRFGSGWAWLIVTETGELAVTSTPNQDNPLMDIAEVKGKPILGLDVWEHAYYLHYQNRRPDYVSAFWNVVDWAHVETLYASVV